MSRLDSFAEATLSKFKSKADVVLDRARNEKGSLVDKRYSTSDIFLSSFLLSLAKESVEKGRFTGAWSSNNHQQVRRHQSQIDPLQDWRLTCVLLRLHSTESVARGLTLASLGGPGSPGVLAICNLDDRAARIDLCIIFRSKFL